MIVLFGPNGISHTNIFPALEKSQSEGLSGCLDYFKPLSEKDNIQSNLPFLGKWSSLCKDFGKHPLSEFSGKI